MPRFHRVIRRRQSGLRQIHFVPNPLNLVPFDQLETVCLGQQGRQQVGQLGSGSFQRRVSWRGEKGADGKTNGVRLPCPRHPGAAYEQTQY